MKSYILVLALISVGGLTRAEVLYANQQLMSNPFMTDNKDGWTPISPWRNDAGENQVFDFNTDGPTGFFATNLTTVDFTSTGTHVSDPDYDVNTARLTGLTFNGIFVGRANETAAGANLEANLFVELTITTSTDSYRAQSGNLENPWAQTAGTYLDAGYNWLNDGTYSGNPFAGSGLVLSDITDINVNYFMHVIGNNSDGSGTVFTTLDNASIEYDVTVIPEPSTLVLLGIAGLGVIAGLRRRR